MRCADLSERLEYGGGHDDVRQLRDGRIGQQAFEVLLPERHDARGDDRERSGVQQPAAARLRKQEIHTEDVHDDLGDRKYTRFDDRHCMQQRTHGCRRNHGGRQPTMHGHDGGLADAKYEQPEQQADRGPLDMACEESTGYEITAARDCYRSR